MDVLGPIIGETAARIVILAAVLLLIAALTLLLVGLALRIFRGRSFGLRGSRNRAPRLSVPDILPVDSRRKLILVRRDTVEHLLLIGGATDLVIEQAIQRNVQPAQRGRPANQAPREGAPQAAPSAPAAAAAARPARPAPVPPPGRPGAPPPQRQPNRPVPVPLRPVETGNAQNEPPAAASAAVVPLGLSAPPRPSRMQPPPSAPIVGAAAGLSSPARPSPAGGTDATVLNRSRPDDPGADPASGGHAEPHDAPHGGEQMKASEAPMPVAEEPIVPTEMTDAEARERAERLSSRENDMAELLGEIFGKK